MRLPTEPMAEPNAAVGPATLPDDRDDAKLELKYGILVLCHGTFLCQPEL